MSRMLKTMLYTYTGHMRMTDTLSLYDDDDDDDDDDQNTQLFLGTCVKAELSLYFLYFDKSNDHHSSHQ